MIESNFMLSTSMKEALIDEKLISRDEQIPAHLRLFVDQCDQALQRAAEMGLSVEKIAELQDLLLQISVRVMNHPVIANNLYLCRFAAGVTKLQARHELQQFSIFAHNFDVAQAQLVANAKTPEDYMRRLKVLLNEKGIPYEAGFDGDLTGEWRPETIHFQWLLNMAAGLGFSFNEVGKIWLALPGTKQFVEATFKYYASADQNVSLGAAFAIENWAANSLWTPWIAGMKKFNAISYKPINLGYLYYHEREEKHHSQTTIDELLDNFAESWFDQQQFLEGAEGMLNEGIAVYYASQLAHLPEKDGNDWPPVAYMPPTATDLID